MDRSTAYVLVRDVAYVTPDGTVARDGVLASPWSDDGPADHVAFFAGAAPSTRDGQPFGFASPVEMLVAENVTIGFQLSAKDPDNPKDADYHVKFRRYLAILGDQADALEPGASAPPFRPQRESDPASPFEYMDTASARAGIVEYARRLELARVAIVGLGGIGSYVLDLVSKTRVGEIHLYDADDFLSHNAFRAPGAAALDSLERRPRKVDHFAGVYSAMKRGIVPHAYALDASNASELSGTDFVFLAMEGGSVKRQLVDALDGLGIPFVDASIDVLPMGGALGGSAQVTTSTPADRATVLERVDFSDPEPDDVYSSNVQIADLNALAAVMAVIKWKKLQGFYFDQARETWSAYGVGINLLTDNQP